MRRNLFLSAVVASALIPMSTAQASTLVSYSDFSNTAGLTLVGNTAAVSTGDGTVLRVTPVGSGQSGAAYSTTPVTLGSNSTFSTTFQFRFTSPGGIDPADGITFVLGKSSSGLGAAGGGIGYQGVLNSVAIEFDTYNNGGGDGNSSNQVGVNANGNLNSLFASSPYGVTTCDFGSGYAKAGCLANGNIWTVKIAYNGTLLDVFVQDGQQAMQHIIDSYAIDIGQHLTTDQAFIGFTAASGAGWENHDILNWQFANTTELVTGGNVPEPASLTLLGLALAGLGMSRRKNKQQ